MPDPSETSPIRPSSEILPLPRPGVICQPVPDGAVLLDTASEVYYGLNPVGREIWELLPPACGTMSSLCAELRRRYPEVSEEMLRGDVVELLDDLIRGGLAQRPG
jgi:hypothetical protein